jgi:cobalt-zinc-cadmium efflux system outer membrane protein
MPVVKSRRGESPVRVERIVALLFSLMFPLCGARGEDIPARLTLLQAVELAVAHHPAIPAAAARISAAEALQRQAGLRPNPAVTFESENWRAWSNPAFEPGRDLDLFIFGSQTLETGGKRSRRVDLAGRDHKIAELEKLVLEWKIRQDVRLAFLRALLAKRQLALLEENGRYFEQVIEYHRARVEQGAMAEVNLIRVQLEGERLRLDEQAARAEAERQRIELLRAMGMAESRADFSLEEIAPVPSPALMASGDVLLSQAREHLPSFLLGEAILARARTRVDLERSLAKPDWAVSFGYKRTAGFNTILAGVSVPLPLFNKNEGTIAASELEVRGVEHTLREITARVAADISSALAGVQRRLEMLSRMQKGILVQAEESLRISLAAYQEGGSDLLRLLDAQKVRNEVQLLYARTQMEYMISLAELENAVGVENLLLPKEIQRVKP